MITYTKHFVSSEGPRECVAELLSTFLLVFMGNNAVAQKVISHGVAGSPSTIYTGYALGAFLGVLVAGGVSGAHMNPAVTLAAAFTKKLEWWKVPHYLIGQYLGAFFAACCTFLLYLDGINDLHAAHGAGLTTAGIFATYPMDNLSVMGGFVDQILGTAVLVMVIYAITDRKNADVPPYQVALYVALLIVSLGCSFGYNEGYAINPARDLAPRVFTYFSCWGDQVFGESSYWYIPIIGPHIGAILGAYTYITLIERMRNEDIVENNNTTSHEVTNVRPGEKSSVGSISVPEEFFKKSASISSQGAYTFRL